MESNIEEEAFFRVISENMKFAFTSPVPTTMQFPTPYSQQQQQQQLLQGHQQHGDHQQPSSQLLFGTGRGSTATDGQKHAEQAQVENQSMVENSMLAEGPGAAKLSDVNMQPSSVLQLSNEFMLTSPEQFKDFLFESPAGFNLWHRTPAKTPLRFFNGSAAGTTSSSADQQGQLGNAQPAPSAATPLRSIDVNLMFNSRDKTAPASSSSPSKRYLSLTPYGKRILSDIGTPYAKLLASSNSALVDFQKARKDVSRASPNLRNVNLPNLTKITPNKSIYQSISPNRGRRDDTAHRRGRHTRAAEKPQREPTAQENRDDQDESDAEDCGSSPTTIQLNSSVTKPTRNKLGFIGAPPPMPFQEDGSSEEESNNIDSRLFEMAKLPLSPTPKPASCNNMDVTQINIPELPKMGSFKSETSASSLPSTAKKVTRKQPKFQIIVTNANSFNSTRGTVMGGETGSKKRKPGLKRSQSEIVSDSANGQGSAKRKNKEQRTSQLNRFAIKYQTGFSSSQ
ncbi:LAME_0B00540g1_1 [Lachancea meyersii CBS 8951]|uniref:LAME_0B00540g1_1 n=1 Tax=Lachancea meyersii CBS 8951 TaxID=1266667 RepID=A0A1G4IT53_9SACH|nr:LAME_0B00540g1_1 [Lachancea meyersii CBS 8951]